MKLLRVAWICHFSNVEIQNRINPKKKINEFAPWITKGIEEVKKRDDIELFVVSPHRWIDKEVNFTEDNIHYYFFNSGIPYYGRHWPGFFRLDLLTNFSVNKWKVKRIINRIKPDIIHLHGIENSYYSSTILQFINKYPILATVQGFISHQISKDITSKEFSKRVFTEKKILRMLTNFGVRTTNIMNEILDSNPRANIYWHEYFVNIPNIEEAGTLESEKIYDLIYFARISKEKGVEDFIKLTGRLCKQYPNLKTVIIGGANESYIKKLKKLAIDNQCSSAIDFQGFLPTQNDVYHILKKSKICVLPTYNDIIPGTIIESMFRKIAVVSYETGGIPDINRDEENILLSKQGDLDSLLSNIQSLLDSSEKRIEMANRAYNYAVKRWSNVKAMHDIVNAYKNIIKDEINK